MIRALNNQVLRCSECGCDITDYASYLDGRYQFWPLCGDCYQIAIYGYVDREPAMRKVRPRSGQRWYRPPANPDHDKPDDLPRRCNVTRREDATQSPFYPYVKEY